MADSAPPRPFEKRRRGGAPQTSSMSAADRRSVQFAGGYPADDAAAAAVELPGLTDEDTVRDDDLGVELAEGEEEGDRKRPAQKSTAPTDDSPSKLQPPLQKYKRPTPMDLAWRQVALDEKEGRIPEYVAETEVEKRMERMSKEAKRDVAELRRIRQLNRDGNDDAYFDALEKYLSRKKNGDADDTDDDDDDDDDNDGDNSLSSFDSDDSNVTRNSSGDKVWKHKVDARTFLANLWEREKRKRVGRSRAAVEDEEEDTANLKRGDDSDDDVVYVDSGSNEDGGGGDDDDEVGDEGDDVPLKEWEQCKMIMNRRSNNKNGPSISSANQMRQLLNFALREYPDATKFLSEGTLEEFEGLEDDWAQYAEMLPKNRRDKSAFDNVLKKDCVECIAMAGGALSTEYAEESKPKITESKLKPGLTKLLAFYRECKKKVELEEAAARRKSEAKAKKAAATKAATARSTSAGRGRPKTMAVLRTHKDQSTAYDFEARIHHPELVSIDICILLIDVSLYRVSSHRRFVACTVAVLLCHRHASSPNISAPHRLYYVHVALPQFKVP